MHWRILLFLFVVPVAWCRPHHPHKSRTSKHTDDDSLLYWRRSNVPECKPFTTFMTDCNKCVCGADSISYCTRMDCRKTTPEIQEIYTY